MNRPDTVVEVHLRLRVPPKDADWLAAEAARRRVPQSTVVGEILGRARDDAVLAPGIVGEEGEALVVDFVRACSPGRTRALDLLVAFRAWTASSARPDCEIGPTRFGEFLRRAGAVRVRTVNGSVWNLAPPASAGGA